MERTRYLFIVLLFIGLKLFAQQNDPIYQAYVSGDMRPWLGEIKHLEQLSLKTSIEELQLLNAYYGYIAWCIDQEQYGDAKLYLRKARKKIDRLEKKNYALDVLYAYRSAFVGFDIGFAPYKAPFIGPKSLEYAQEAKRLSPQCAFAYVQLGNIAYYTPKMFGGSKSEALDYYQKALVLMENAGDTLQNWNYLNLRVTIILAEVALEMDAKAHKEYLELMAFEPRLEWLKEEMDTQKQER